MKPTSHYKTSSFREELLVILKKPYNLEEYRSLMQKAKYRHLNWAPEYSDGLKGKDISNTYGKSPLDYHPGRLIIDIDQLIHSMTILCKLL